ncbi:MSEP-CTERM sorting domain-containing protein [Rubellicoccus peritrichatus]|uniref:MSEP-CTERM sorting domain-containing protein n=1 Tax=Rubellicoccus peritrichatus TaxID=3080537 RepID=A0AAQ3LH40_9BACT|nr:MSEP-CTERM sorting domain-containing protein [Puniceicoccus sp. CR14]WOO42034.1 MSEP-CTERM sorting domain-containing protein [Puniceicoccus sp. CR14]
MEPETTPSEPSQSPSTKPIPEPLLPDLMHRPHLLIWVWLIPQVILLLLNLYSYDLAIGEMTDDQQQLAWIWGGFNLANIAAAIALTTYFLIKRKAVSIWLSVGLLIAQVGYIWMTTVTIDKLVPSVLEAWILPSTTVLFQQWTWSMPGAFYAALRLAGFRSHLSRGRDIGLSILCMIGPPVGLYLSGWLLDKIGIRWYHSLGTQVMIGLFTGATLCLGFGLLRFLLLLFKGVLRGNAWKLFGFTLIFALLMPLGGLWLNTEIPFPADYQDTWVYIMTCLNALFLMLPAGKNRNWNLSLYLLRCLSFAFTLYFFVVFLPYLPLSILAILVAGAGFLILTPSVLFIVHIIKIQEALKAGLPIGKWTTCILGLLAFSIMPGWITLEGLYQRQQLMQGLDYVYAPEIGSDKNFQGNSQAVADAVDWLNDYKAGRYLPYLTPYRSWLMFDGLVLPDKKMERIYRAFTGEELAKPDKDSGWGFGFFSARSTNRNAGTMRRGPPPPSDVALTSVDLSTEVKQEVATSILHIEMTAGDHWQSEFVTHINIPEGVYVTNFWLHIGNERVPGKLFEKKSALWVYQMIRDSRRDPGLLFYTKPDELELRVFPFAKNQTRIIEIEFTYPSNYARSLFVGKEEVRLGGVDRVAMVTSIGDSIIASLNRPALDELPLIQRKPYWHFIVDRSIHGPDAEQLSAAIEQLRNAYPEVADARATLANYQSIEVNKNRGPESLDTIEALLTNEQLGTLLPQDGGFLPSRTIMESFADYEKTDLRKGENFERFPIFVLLTNTESQPIIEDLEPFASFTPEAQGVLISKGANLTVVDWNGEPINLPEPGVIPPVGMLSAGEVVRPTLYGIWTATFDFEGGPGPLTFLETEGHTFVPMDRITQLPPSDLYSRAMQLNAEVTRLDRNPGKRQHGLADQVLLAKEAGVLTPFTAYIVVENSAQWKMLKRTEKQKLSGNPELEKMETPEPSVWFLAVILLALEWLRRKLRPQKEAHA